MTNYTFSVGLWASNGSGGLDQSLSGTLTLDDDAAPSVTGVLTLGDGLPPIPFSGSLASPAGVSASVLTATGEAAEGGRSAAAELTLSYGSDQIVYAGFYVGGLVNLLDSEQQEWLYYIVQGMSPESPRS